MFKQRKARIISAFVCAAIIWVIAVSVMGVSPASVTVKLTPAMVSVDTTALSPKLAQAEMNFAWRLFDRDTATAYMPMQTARVTVSLSETRSLSGIHVYGSPSYQINVYRDNAGNVGACALPYRERPHDARYFLEFPDTCGAVGCTASFIRIRAPWKHNHGNRGDRALGRRWVHRAG